MKRIILVALLGVAPAVLAATPDTSAQTNRDGRWLKTEIQKFEKVQAWVADPAARASDEDANAAMFLAGYVNGIISIEKFHAQMGATISAGAADAGRAKKISPNEAKGVGMGIKVAAPLSDTEFPSEQLHVDQYVQAIKNYLEKHPDKWDLGAAQVIEYTLWEMFPHKKGT
jgi:hypothetical protein